MNWSDNISKRRLWRYVNKKINRSIHHSHVLSVITILFDEILKDLKEGKSLHIYNFGTLSLCKTKGRGYYDVVFQKVMQAGPHRIIKFKLDDEIHSKLRSLIDIEKTFLERS